MEEFCFILFARKEIFVIIIWGYGVLGGPQCVISPSVGQARPGSYGCIMACIHPEGGFCPWIYMQGTGINKCARQLDEQAVAELFVGRERSMQNTVISV